MELIICSAIWYKDLPTQRLLPINVDKGIVVCGHRHAHCIDIVKMLSGLRSVMNGNDSVGETIQGFLTNENRFVDRYEGFDIAEAQNQLNDRPRAGRTLYSEDLY